MGRAEQRKSEAVAAAEHAGPSEPRTKRRRKGAPKLPQASRRATVQVFQAAWEAIRSLEHGGTYQDLPVFTQDWLEQSGITDHGNARSVLSLLELINAEGVLDPKFVGCSRQAMRTQDYQALRGFLRDRLCDSLGRRSADSPVPSDLWDSFGQDSFRKESLESFLELAGGQSADRKRKFRTCLEGLLEVIRYCGNQEYLQKVAYPDARTGLPGRDERGCPADSIGPQQSPKATTWPGMRGRFADGLTGQRVGTGSLPHVRTFFFSRHEEVKVWFDCAETSENLKQIGLRLLEEADRLRQIEHNITSATLQVEGTGQKQKETADRKMG